MRVPISEGQLKACCWMATLSYGGGDDMFNSAGFSAAWSATTGLCTLDGYIVEAILSGREWVEKQPDCCHWRLK